MSELDSTLNIRMASEKRARIDAAAAELGMTRSEWANKVIDDALRGYQPKGRQVRVFKGRVIMAGARDPRHCEHPPAVRSEPHPVTGEQRCLACNSVFRRLS